MLMISFNGICIEVFPKRVTGLKSELNLIFFVVINNLPCNKILSFNAQLNESNLISPSSKSFSFLYLFALIVFNLFNSSSFIFLYGFSIFVNSRNLFLSTKFKLSSSSYSSFLYISFSISFSFIFSKLLFSFIILLLNFLKIKLSNNKFGADFFDSKNSASFFLTSEIFSSLSDNIFDWELSKF